MNKRKYLYKTKEINEKKNEQTNVYKREVNPLENPKQISKFFKTLLCDDKSVRFIPHRVLSFIYSSL